MHMANELLSVPVAAGTLGGAAAGLAFICHKAKKEITSDRFALMGIMGAFVFAAQMVNFQLPLMPGTSGHMVGAVLLAIILGPYAGAIVISSVVIIQCLIFQDGGLLALGCNIINMAIVPSFLGYWVYKLFAGSATSQWRFYLGSILACVIALVAGAVLVPIEAGLSGVLRVPFYTFLITMVAVHILIGIVEGLITAAVLVYLRQVRPDIITECVVNSPGFSKRVLYTTLITATIIIGGVISLFASSLPDGLEWSYAERPNEPDFETLISNDSRTVTSIDNFQSRYSPLPDYTVRASAFGEIAQGQFVEAGPGWQSFAAVFGSALTMGAIWLAAWVLRKKNGGQNAPRTD
jgi:cobalt/nickel transport system permease protein